jgi:hypothetical protein
LQKKSKHAHIPDYDYWEICLFHVLWTNFFLQLFLCGTHEIYFNFFSSTEQCAWARIIAKKNWFTRHETDIFLNNHSQECVRAYLSIHDCLSFLHEVMIGNHRTKIFFAFALLYGENRIICCQIFCDLLLKSAFERIFNVMQLILVKIKWHIKWKYLIQKFQTFVYYEDKMTFSLNLTGRFWINKK